MNASSDLSKEFSEFAEGFLDAVRNLPKTDRGRKHALRATCPPGAIKRAAEYVTALQLGSLIDGWIAEDKASDAIRAARSGAAPKHPGGRPPKLSPHTFWVVAQACALASLPMSYTQLHHVLTAEYEKGTRSLLGFDVSADPEEDARLDRERREIGYTSFTRLAKRVTETFDPRPFPSQRGLTQEELAEIDAARDPQQVALRQRRADRLQAKMLTACYLLLPRELRKRWNGDVTFDATVVPTYGKFGHSSRRRKVNGAVSPEANSGLHAKDQDSRDAASQPFVKPGKASKSKKDKVFTHGYDLHTALLFADDYPQLILGVSLDTPGCIPGINAAEALRGIADAGLPTGTLTVDLGYSQLRPEHYALLARALGYDLMHEFKRTKNDLGIQATYEGINCIEGTLYGPCMPPDLVNASLDRYVHQSIDEDTYQRRIEMRRAYEVRVKLDRNGDYAVTYRCPGTGPHATVSCPIKDEQRAKKREAKVAAALAGGEPAPKPEAGRRPLLPLVITAPTRPPKLCSNTESISVPRDVFARYLTTLPYKTPEYRKYYAAARNRMEGKNRVLKNGLDADIADKDQRRYRGWAKQFATILAKVVAANVTAIIVWVDDEERRDKNPPAKRLGRPKNSGLEAHRPQPNGPPLRIIGPNKPTIEPAA